VTEPATVRSVCVFCGSRTGNDPTYTDDAVAVARLLVARGIRIVYGGAAVGTMGVLADAALAAGGEVVGVIPGGLFSAEVPHAGLTDLRVVGSMHERKQVMAGLAGAFLALPGGLGTLEELAEIVTWSLLGLHAKPIGILNRNGYYDHLLAFLDRARSDGFLRPEHRAIVQAAPDPEAAVALVAASR
jgi:uncharacterized protein (TIGR00730 family)